MPFYMSCHPTQINKGVLLLRSMSGCDGKRGLQRLSQGARGSFPGRLTPLMLPGRVAVERPAGHQTRKAGEFAYPFEWAQGRHE
jgi:hypothetical protein